MVDEHATAGRERVDQRRGQRGGLLLVGEKVQDAAQHQADRPVPVEQFAGRTEHPFWIAQVAPDGERPAVVGQQRGGVRDHHRVVIQVDNVDILVEALGNLVHVLHGGQAGADVEQLGNAFVADHVPDDAGQHVALRPHTALGHRQQGDHPVRQRPVGREVVSPAEQIVVNARVVRAGGVDLGRLGHEKTLRPTSASGE
jgi:hypothetical protein